MEEIRESPCPACGEAVLEGEEFCPGCLASTTAPRGEAVDVDVDVHGEVGPEAEVLTPPREPPPAIGPDPDAPRCEAHPDKPIATTCARCGRFLCVDCEPGLLRREEVTCRRCKDRVKLEGAPERLRRIALELAVTYGVIGGLIILFVTVMPIVTGAATADVPEEAQGFARGVFVGVGLFFSLPFFVTGAIVLLTRSVIAAWVGFGLLVMAGLLGLLVAFATAPMMGLLPVLAGLLALFRCIELTTLTGLSRRSS
ncbi:MAG: hypothetical protein P1V51_02175 [Deltaproteobacteria bacterium]|nr:hypothetical protein [Deltaproteobacteria bacterium]